MASKSENCLRRTGGKGWNLTNKFIMSWPSICESFTIQTSTAVSAGYTDLNDMASVAAIHLFCFVMVVPLGQLLPPSGSETAQCLRYTITNITTIWYNYTTTNITTILYNYTTNVTTILYNYTTIIILHTVLYPERNLHVFPSPDVHASIVFSQFVEIVPLHGKQASGHRGTSAECKGTTDRQASLFADLIPVEINASGFISNMFIYNFQFSYTHMYLISLSLSLIER